MAQNISQIYIANPASSMASLDLIYLGRSPYGIADDFAIEFGDFQDSISSIGAALDVTVGNNLLVSDTNGILDESSNAQLLFSTTASAVNYLNLSNAATGNGPSLVVAGTDTDIDLNINAKGTGDVLFNGSDVICGDPGTEASGININGVTYDSALKVSDIAGANIAQFILHRHSTTSQSLIVGARSNSDTSAHGVVTNGQSLLTTYGAGWTASHYDIFGCIDIGVDSAGTVSATSSPGRLLFQVTADASNTPTTALTIGNDKAATFAGALSAASLQVDNVNIDGNTVSSTSGTLVLSMPVGGNLDLVIPTAGAAVKIINTAAAGRTGFIIYRNTSDQMFTLFSGLTSAGGVGGDHTFLSNKIAGGNVYLSTTAGNALATSGVDVIVGGSTSMTQAIISKVNGTEASNAVTASGGAGVVTTSALTTAAAGNYAITWTNTLITSTSTVALTLQGGTNTIKDVLFQFAPGSGSATLTIYNNHASSALNGTLLIGYTIF